MEKKELRIVFGAGLILLLIFTLRIYKFLWPLPLSPAGPGFLR